MMKLRFSAMALLCLAVLIPLPAPAADIPAGSYLKSCRQVQVRWGRDLAAFCATRAGEWVVSRLDDFMTCGGDIANLDGQLACNEEVSPGALYGAVTPPPPSPLEARPAPVPQRPPAGSYTASCRSPRLDGGWLQATCRDAWGNWREAGLSLTGCPVGADIVNDDGKLKCRSFTSQYAGDYPPPGSYLQTCRDIALESGALRGMCLNRRGTWMPTTLYLSWCSGREVVNDDGSLKCAPASGWNTSGTNWSDTPPPRGSYLATCRDVRVSGGTLGAMCQDRSGTYRTSISLILSQCERGADIFNDNGTLRCSRAGSSFGEHPPPGSYMASCRDARVTAGWLKATCRDRNGRWVDATTAVSWCGPGRDIANMDGRLTCR